MNNEPINTSEDNLAEKQKKLKIRICITLVLLIGYITLLRNYGIAIVQGPSMEPTFHQNNVLIMDKTYPYLTRFDVVMIYTKDTKHVLIKRLIGLPGETVTYKDNQLYINDQKIDDYYNSNYTNDFEVVLGEDEYYCLGDNRKNSSDSRFYGPFHKKDFIGKSKRRS